MYRLIKWLLIFFLALSIILPGEAAAFNPPQIPDSPYVDGELLIRFTPQASKSALTKAAVHNKIGGVVQKEYKEISGLQFIKLPQNMSVTEAVNKYKNNPNILYAEPNYIIHHSKTIPNDQHFSLLWGLLNTGQSGGTPGADINATEAWDYTTGSPNVIVAVLDTGVDHNHEDLKNNILLLPNANFIDSDPDTMDKHGHGTHVAGTIAAQGNNSIGIVGVMWNAKIIPVKVLGNDGSGTMKSAADGIIFAANNGAHIINMSLGGPMPSTTIQDAIEYASSSLVVCAAGNSGNDLDDSPTYPASFNLPNMINVAATGRHDELASFSNYSPNCVHVAAPGVSILSTLPGGYGFADGTSMAAPHVAGLAGLIKAQNPVLSTLDIKAILMDSVDITGTLTGVIVTEGRVNAKKAIELAMTYIPADIPDSTLALTVRNALNKPEGTIYTKDLENLTSLSAPGVNITDLTGMEHAVNLITLNLSGNRISSLSPLLLLDNLQTLDISLNDLNLSTDSPALQQIQTLLDKGVDVSYIPQNTSFIEEQTVEPEDNTAEAGEVKLEFETVSGTVNIQRRSSPSYPAPENYQFINAYYKLSVDGSYSGTVRVTIPYDAAYDDVADRIRIIHYISGTEWEVLQNITVDKAARTISGETTTFSDFYGTVSMQSDPDPPTYGSYGANTNFLWLFTCLLLLAGLTLTKRPKRFSGF
jgi:subtilisin family serine protease